MSFKVVPLAARRVLKFAVNAGPCQIDYSGKPKHLHFGYQKMVPQMWVECDPFMTPESWVYVIHGTGEEIEPGFEWIGTTIAPNGFHVWHLYGKRVT